MALIGIFRNLFFVPATVGRFEFWLCNHFFRAELKFGLVYQFKFQLKSDLQDIEW